MTLTLTLILMTSLGAALQVAALLRYLARAARVLRVTEARVVERGYAHRDWDDFDGQYEADIRNSPRQVKRDYAVDVSLLGSGALLTAGSSIAALLQKSI